MPHVTVRSNLTRDIVRRPSLDPVQGAFAVSKLTALGFELDNRCRTT
jgi:hypothetical protein